MPTTFLTKGTISWLVTRALVVVVPALVGATVALLTEAGLLDPAVQACLDGVQLLDSRP
jgi:hypothetical protein